MSRFQSPASGAQTSDTIQPGSHPGVGAERSADHLSDFGLGLRPNGRPSFDRSSAGQIDQHLSEFDSRDSTAALAEPGEHSRTEGAVGAEGQRPGPQAAAEPEGAGRAAGEGERGIDSLPLADRRRAERIISQMEDLYQAQQTAEVRLARRLSGMSKPRARQAAINATQRGSLSRGRKLGDLQQELAEILRNAGPEQRGPDGAPEQPQRETSVPQTRSRDRNIPDRPQRDQNIPETNRRDRNSPQRNRPEPERDRETRRQPNNPDRTDRPLAPQEERRVSELASQIERIEGTNRRAQERYEQRRESYVESGRDRAVEVLDRKHQRSLHSRVQRLADLQSELEELRGLRDREPTPPPDRDRREERRRDRQPTPPPERDRPDESRRDQERTPLPDRDRRDEPQRERNAPPDPLDGQREVLRGQSWMNDLSPQWQRAISTHIAQTDRAGLERLQAVFASDGFQDIVQADTRNGNHLNKQQLLNIVFNSSGEGMEELANALNKRRGDPPQSILLDKDSTGQTTLSNIHEIAVANTFADPALKAQRRELMRSALEALARPAEVNQGSKGTCMATDPLWQFTGRDPAEVSRLFSDLVINGRSDFRREGRSCTLEPESFKADVNWNTTLFDQVLSASFMEHANGDNMDYRYDSDNHLVEGTEREASQKHGLYQHQQRRLLESFYGKDFVVYHQSAGMDDLMKQLNANLTSGPVHSLVSWNDTEGTTGGEDKHKHSNHAVSIVSIREDRESGETRVYFRNPWGESRLLNGMDIDDDGPARRMEDRTQGIESMSLAEFKRRCLSITVKSD